jgi:uncharacterized membrane protein
MSTRKIIAAVLIGIGVLSIASAAWIDCGATCGLSVIGMFSVITGAVVAAHD